MKFDLSADRLDKLHEQIIDIANLPPEASTTLPKTAYTDPQHYEFEVEHVLKKEWLCVGHVSQVPKVGDYINLDLLEEPMVMVRGKDHQVRVLSRVCTHRGMDVMPREYGHPEKGNTRVFLCPYHFWGYDLDGQLKGAPEMNGCENFSRKDFCLHNYRSEVWEGFVFVNLSNDAPPMSEHWAAFKEKLSPWSAGELEMVVDIGWDCKFNWKVLVENFMEYYHHMGAHSKTLEPMLPARGCYTEPENPTFAMAHLPLAKHLQEKVDLGKPDLTFTQIPSVTGDAERKWYVFCGHPTFLVFSAPDQFFWYRILPKGPNEIHLLTTLLIHPSAKLAPDYSTRLETARKALKDFHMEDMEVCEAVQKGMHASVFTPGRLCHMEKPIWLVQRYLANMIKAAHERANGVSPSTEGLSLPVMSGNGELAGAGR